MFRIPAALALNKHNGFISSLLILIFLILAFSIGFGRLWSHSIWNDEAVTVKLAGPDNSLSEVLQAYRAPPHRRPNPPLYYVFVHYSMKLWDNEFGLRFPSLIFGTGALLGIFLLGRRLFGNFIGFISAFLLFLSPKFLLHLRDGNPYTMFICGTVFSTYFLIAAHQTQRILHWFGFVFWSLVALGSQLFAIIFFAAQAMGYLALAGFPEALRRGQIKSLLGREKGFIYAAGLLSFICGLWILIMYGTGGGTQSVSENPWFSLPSWAGSVAYIYTEYFSSIFYPILFALGFFCLFSLENHKAIFLSIFILVPLLIQLPILTGAGQVAPRYFSALVPVVCIFTACSVRVSEYMVLRWKSPPAAAALLRMGMLILLAGLLIADILKLVKEPTHYQVHSFRKIAKSLTEFSRHNDVIFTCADFIKNPLAFYYKGPAEIVGVLRDSDFPAFYMQDGPVPENYLAYLRQTVDPAIINKQRIWLVLSHAKGDQPVVSYLNNFRRKIAGRDIVIKTRAVGTETEPDVALILFELYAE